MTGHQGRMTWSPCSKLECSEKVAAPTHLEHLQDLRAKLGAPPPMLIFSNFCPAVMPWGAPFPLLWISAADYKRSLIDIREKAGAKKRLCSWMQLSPMAPAGRQYLCLWWCRIFVWCGWGRKAKILAASLPRLMSMNWVIATIKRNALKKDCSVIKR